MHERRRKRGSACVCVMCFRVNMYFYTCVYVFMFMCMRTHSSLSGACVCVQESKSRGDTQGETRWSWIGSGQSTWASTGGSTRAAQRDRLGSWQRRAQRRFRNFTLRIKPHPPHQTPPYSSYCTSQVIMLGKSLKVSSANGAWYTATGTSHITAQVAQPNLQCAVTGYPL